MIVMMVKNNAVELPCMMHWHDGLRLPASVPGEE